MPCIEKDCLFIWLLYRFTIKQKNGTDELFYEPESISKSAKAVAFILNNEERMKKFVDKPDVELCQSCCERALRFVTVAKRAFMFIASADGAEAFSDYQTVANTCRLNEISTLDYMVWFITNCKYRLSLMRKEGKEDPTMFAMPGTLNAKGFRVAQENLDEEEDVYHMYDPQNNLCYDKIDLTGLMPYDYAQYLKQYKPQSKEMCSGAL